MLAVQGEMVDCFWIAKRKRRNSTEVYFCKGREKKVVAKEKTRYLKMRRENRENLFELK